MRDNFSEPTDEEGSHESIGDIVINDDPIGVRLCEGTIYGGSPLCRRSGTAAGDLGSRRSAWGQLEWDERTHQQSISLRDRSRE